MTPAEQATTCVKKLRARGFTVITDQRKPGVNASYEFTPTGVLLHHTASSSVTDISRELGDIAFIQRDQPGWPAPHAHWYVGRTGRIYLLCAGVSYHAGSGNELVNQGIPANLGNKYLWGIEVQSDGYGMDWTEKEWEATHALTGELLRAMNRGVNRVWRHKDYDNDSGKVDTRYPLADHRNAVKAYWDGQLQREADEMTKEDWERLGKMLDNRLAAVVPVIVRTVLNTDVAPKDDELDLTVRQALRKAALEDDA